MRTILLLSLVALVVAVDYETAFQEWLVQQQKIYPTDVEYKHRLAVFTQNAKYIEEENSKGNSWVLGYTRFADLTNEEYRAIYLMPPTNFTYTPVVENVQSVTNVDWRTGGCVTGIKNQGQCGSCYTFGAAAAMEFCHCKAAGKLVSLSEQQCVDCSSGYGNYGCNGGWQENCWSYFKAYGGEDTEASYPYTAVKGTCKASSGVVGAKVTSYSSCTATEAGLQTCIVGHVTAVAIDASLPSFQLYTSGVYCPTGCSTTSLDHAVTAVGQQSGATTGGDYYIVKNSWGTGWGLSGYIYMCANHNNNCGICTHANYPTGCS